MSPQQCIFVFKKIQLNCVTSPLTECIPNHEIKPFSKFQSDQSSNCFTIDVWKINCCMQQFIFLLSYCYLYLILLKFWGLLTCDILGIGLLFGALFIWDNIICSRLRMKKSHNFPLILNLSCLLSVCIADRTVSFGFILEAEKCMHSKYNSRCSLKETKQKLQHYHELIR